MKTDLVIAPRDASKAPSLLILSMSLVLAACRNEPVATQASGISDATVASASTTAVDANKNFTGVWGSAQTPMTTTFSNTTVRDVVHPTAGGSGIRLHFSNLFGGQLVTLQDVSIGIVSQGAAETTGSSVPVTFNSGQTTLTMKAGAEAVSDTVPLTYQEGASLAITFYLPGPAGATRAPGRRGDDFRRRQ